MVQRARADGRVDLWFFGGMVEVRHRGVDAYIPAIFLLLCVYLLPRPTATHFGRGPHSRRRHAVSRARDSLSTRRFTVALETAPVHDDGLDRDRGLPPGRPRASGNRLRVGLPVGISGWNAGGLSGWITTRSPGSVFTFNPLSDVGYTLRGTLRLFFGGRVGALGSAIR